MRRQKSLRIGVHLANAVVWGPVYRTRVRARSIDRRDERKIQRRRTRDARGRRRTASGERRTSAAFLHLWNDASFSFPATVMIGMTTVRHCARRLGVPSTDLVRSSRRRIWTRARASIRLNGENLEKEPEGRAVGHTRAPRLDERARANDASRAGATSSLASGGRTPWGTMRCARLLARARATERNF